MEKKRKYILLLLLLAVGSTSTYLYLDNNNTTAIAQPAAIIAIATVDTDLPITTPSPPMQWPVATDPIAGPAVVPLVTTHPASTPDVVDTPVITPDPVTPCVFNTIFREVADPSTFECTIPANVKSSLAKSMSWLVKAQKSDGSWNAIFPVWQPETNKKKAPEPVVQTDIATTSMAALAIMQCDPDHKQEKCVRRAANFICSDVMSTTGCLSSSPRVIYTQPQMKLGHHIDAVLACQFLLTATDYLTKDAQLIARMDSCAVSCISSIEDAFSEDGNMEAGTWASALQSSLATNALECALDKGYDVDQRLLDRARDYQMSRVDTETYKVRSDDAAGVMLYAVSGSARSSAVLARRAREVYDGGRSNGTLGTSAQLSVDNLVKCGVPSSQAMKMVTACEVNAIANTTATAKTTLTGVGSNGGEEFLSFLQTGEAMLVAHQQDWKKWYSETCRRLLSIQAADGSWQGHHCITSPIFCTATCMLILGIAGNAEDYAGYASEMVN